VARHSQSVYRCCMKNVTKVSKEACPGAFKEGRWIHCDGSYITSKFKHEDSKPDKCVAHGKAEWYFARPGLKQSGHFENGVWSGLALIA
jgi:hypothetical protein